jgi:hypothetical protein
VALSERTLTHGNIVCAGLKNMFGYRSGQGLNCSLYDEQEQDRALTRILPNANEALHFRVILTNFHIDQSTVVKANHDVNKAVGRTELTEYCGQAVDCVTA